MGLNGSISLFSDMGDTLTALNEFVRHFGWKEITIISEIQETFLEVIKAIYGSLVHKWIQAVLYSREIKAT